MTRNKRNVRRLMGAALVALASAVALQPLIMARPAAAVVSGYTTVTSTGNSIVPGTTDVGNHGDDVVTTVALPFPVTFYGTTFTSTRASSNGNLQFTSASSAFSNACLPTSALGAAIVPFWDDLRTDGVGGGVFSAVTGTAPHRQFVLEWRATYFGRSGTANFEIIFNEDSPTITTIYGATADNGSSATAGVQNGSGGPFTQFSCNSGVLANGLRVDYVPGDFADLAVTKSVSPDPVQAGSDLTYTVTVTNNGPNDAQSVVLSDPLPAGTTFVSETQTAGPTFTCAAPPVGGTGTVSCTIATLASRASASFTIVVRVDPSTAEGTTISNTASVSAADPPDGDPTNNSATATATATRVPSSITLPGTVRDFEHQPLIHATYYNPDFENVGGDDRGIVSAELGSDNTPVYAHGQAGTLTTHGEDNFNQWYHDTAGANVSVPLSISARLISTSPPTYQYSSNFFFPIDHSGWNASPPEQLDRGDDGALHNFSFTYEVHNSFTYQGGETFDFCGDDDVWVFINRRLVIDLGGVHPTECAGVAVDSLGLTPGATYPFDFFFAERHTTGSNFRLTTSLQLAASTPPAADLSITKADSPDPVLNGGTLTYTLTAHNAGPDPASGVSVTDTLPGTVDFISASASQGSCNQSSGTVNCDLGSLASGGGANVTITVTPREAGTITNTASVSAAEADPNTANNADSEDTTVNPAADLSITKADSPDPVLNGGTLTYTLTVHNGGPDDATGVVVTDDLPDSVTFVSASASQGSCNQSSGTVTCALGGLAGGGDATVTITVTPRTGGTFTNTASVSADQADPNTANNAANEDTTVNPAADLSITKADSPDPVLNGGTLTYTVSVHNAGPDMATAVTVTDNLPAAVTFNSANPSQGTCSQFSGTVSCNLGTMGSGGSATVTIIVTPTAPGTITNTASVSADQADPNGANNTAIETTTVNPAADLYITKADSPDPVLNGGTVTYTLSVHNTGPDPASGVSVTDTLPGTVEFVSASASQGSCTEASGTVSCPLGSMTSGGDAIVTITVTPRAAGTITNTATVFGNETDRNPENNSTTEETTVKPAADLSVAKADSPDPVLNGGTLTYTIRVDNAGPDAASNVAVTDALPASVDFVSASPSQGSCPTTPPAGASGTVTCDLGSLASGGTATVTIVVTPTTPGTITDTASVSATEADPNEANNSDSEETTVLAAADLSITKSDSPDPVLVGETLTYTITVNNAGPDAATDVVVSDTLPASVHFVSATASQGTCVEFSGMVSCDLGTLANAGTATVTIKVTPTKKETITNTTRVSSGVADPHLTNNSATASTRVVIVVGGAYGARVHVKTALGDTKFGPTPSVTLPPGGGGPFTDSLAGVSVSGILGVDVLRVSTEGGRSGSDIVVRSSADGARADIGNGTVAASGIHSECQADLEGAHGSASVAKLVIFGQPVDVSTAPNTKITIPGVGVLIVNEQTTDQDGTITVNVLHLKLNGSLGKGDIILAQSRCGIDP